MAPWVLAGQGDLEHLGGDVRCKYRIIWPAILSAICLKHHGDGIGLGTYGGGGTP